MAFLFRSVTVAIVLSIVASAFAQADELREWRDSSGKHKRRGVFQKLEEGRVHLKTEAGEPFSILMSQLSTQDVDYVRSLQSSQSIDPFDSSGVGTPEIAASGKSTSTAGPADAEVRLVIVSGAGVDVESAKQDAHREAVRQVVGALVDSETLVQNDQLLQDRVITLSSAFVQKSETLSSGADQGVMRVRVKASVRISPLLEALRDNRISARRVDAQSLDAEQTTRLDQAQATLDLLSNVFPKFRSTCFEVEVVGKPTLGEVTADATELVVSLRISPRLKAYISHAQRLDEILSAKERLSGEFVSDGEKPGNDYQYCVRQASPDFREVFAAASDKAALDGNDRDKFGLRYAPLYFIYDPVASRDSLWGLSGLRNNVWRNLSDDTRVIVVMRHANASGARTRWRWFATSPKERLVIEQRLPSMARCVTVLKDSEGQEIARDETKLLLCGINQCYNATFVSPFVQYEEGFYSPRLAFNRRFRLSPEEVKNVSLVEAYFDDTPLVNMSGQQ